MSTAVATPPKLPLVCAGRAARAGVQRSGSHHGGGGCAVLAAPSSKAVARSCFAPSSVAWWQPGVWWKAAKHADTTGVVVRAVLLRRLGPYVWSMLRRLMIGCCIVVAFCTLARTGGTTPTRHDGYGYGYGRPLASGDAGVQRGPGGTRRGWLLTAELALLAVSSDPRIPRSMLAKDSRVDPSCGEEGARALAGEWWWAASLMGVRRRRQRRQAGRVGGQFTERARHGVPQGPVALDESMDNTVHRKAEAGDCADTGKVLRCWHYERGLDLKCCSPLLCSLKSIDHYFVLHIFRFQAEEHRQINLKYLS
ncbi:uncharacterized protein [Triticum aestivum]|uniref:uncharacterized protein isoform X2 n=1 Tax=Triticum aestivum TaxID=4565 RepID=UPI001D01280E|nr:uncharacterized protein LOC123186712 isoform X2 [Triticum aestivum]